MADVAQVERSAVALPLGEKGAVRRPISTPGPHLMMFLGCEVQNRIRGAVGTESRASEIGSELVAFKGTGCVNWSAKMFLSICGGLRLRGRAWAG